MGKLRSPRSPSRSRAKGGSRSRQRRASGNTSRASSKSDSSPSASGPTYSGSTPTGRPRSNAMDSTSTGRTRSNAVTSRDGGSAAQEGDGTKTRFEAAKSLAQKMGDFLKKPRGITLEELKQRLGIEKVSSGGSNEGETEDTISEEEHQENVDKLFDNPNDAGASEASANLYETELNQVNEQQPNLTRRQAAKEATKRAVERMSANSKVGE